MKAQWSIANKITIGLGLALLMLGVIGVVAYRSPIRLIETAGWVAHTHSVIAIGSLLAFTLVAAASFLIHRDIAGRRRAEESLLKRTTELEEATTFLDSVIEHLPSGVFVKAADDLRFVSWNKANEELIGLRRDEVLGKHDYDLFPKDEADFFVAKDRQVLSGNQVVDIPEEAVQTAHQGVRLLYTRKVPIFGADGKPKYLLGISMDITERKRAAQALQQAYDELELRVQERTAELARANTELRAEIAERRRAEEELRESEARFAGIVTLARDAIISVDEAQRIQLFNREAERIFGYRAEELLGQPLEVLLPARLAETHRAHIQAFAAAPVTGRGMNERGSVFGRRKDGSEFPAEASISKIELRAGKLLTVILRDITERKRAEEALRQSEERFRLIVDTALDAVITMDAQGAITGWNAQAENMFGWSRQEVVGQYLSDALIPHRYREAHQRGLKYFLATGEGPVLNKRIEITALHRDRHEFPVELSITPLKSGQAFTFSAFVRDITEHKQVEAERLKLVAHEQAARAEAEATQQRLSFLVEAGALLAESFDYFTRLKQVAQLVVPRMADWCAVDVLDEEDVLRRAAVVHTDPAKVELAYELQRRYPPDPSAPRGVYNVLRTGQSELYPEIPDALLVASAQDEDHLTLARRLGLQSAMMVPLLAHGQTLGVITLVAAESGRRFGVEDLALTEDLARRAAALIENARLYRAAQHLNAELERRVVERTVQLEAANKELEAFSYSVSHDLRAPLRGIDGFSQALLEDYADALDATGKDYLRRVRAAAQRMAELIDDLLQLSRVTRGELRREPVDLSALASSIAAALRQREPGRAVDVTIADGVMVQGDPRLLRVLLENLLGNAWKFTGKRPHAHIEFGVTHHDGTPAYFVRDDGAGFDMAYAGKLFGAFQRLHAATEFEGTGIGLATVARIVHRHGGRVEAEGAVEQGATFSFTLC